MRVFFKDGRELQLDKNVTVANFGRDGIILEIDEPKINIKLRHNGEPEMVNIDGIDKASVVVCIIKAFSALITIPFVDYDSKNKILYTNTITEKDERAAKTSS